MSARGIGMIQERAAAYSFVKNDEQIRANRAALRHEIRDGFLNWVRIEEYASYFETQKQEQDARENLALRPTHTRRNLIQFLFRE